MKKCTSWRTLKINNPLGLLSWDPLASSYAYGGQNLIHSAYEARWLVLGRLNARNPCYFTLGVQSAFGRPVFLGKIWDAIRYVKEKIADHSKTVSVLTSREIVLQNNLMQSTEQATTGGATAAISRQLETAVEIGYSTDFRPRIA